MFFIGILYVGCRVLLGLVCLGVTDGWMEFRGEVVEWGKNYGGGCGFFGIVLLIIWVGEGMGI